MKRSLLTAAVAVLALSSIPASAQPGQASAAQVTRPQPLPRVDTIPAARDIAFPGTMRLEVDATDTTRGIYRVVQTIPVPQAGRMTLLLPEWLPGNHAARGTVANLAGLRVTAGNRVLPWRRDPADVYAFHVDVPAGVREVRAEFQHLSPTQTNQGRVTMTPALLNLQPEKMSLYPAGYYVRNIPVQATVTFPEGWTAATSLDIASRRGNRITYRPVSYETLVDSPIFAGPHYRRESLGHDIHLNVFAERPQDLAISPEALTAHRNLADQALKLFGSRHYDEYEFLLGLTEELGGIGLEHLRSSENTHPRNHFTEWNPLRPQALLPHELVHSWNGKYRRGADLFTPDYRVPMQNSLLWVYEGQTQFWGNILAARSGIMSREAMMGELARTAAFYASQPGRSWRPVVDTTNDPIIQARRPHPWTSYMRSEDYYSEGMLIWLDVDSRIREMTRGQRSMDDFARAFFGVNPGDEGTLTYTFDDVVRTLNAVAPFDWGSYLRRRVEETGPTPLEWIERGGYRLAFRDTPTSYFSTRERELKIADLTYTLGAIVGEGGTISNVFWESPLFNEGVVVGTVITAVNGQAYSHDTLRAAIREARTSRRPIRLLTKRGERYREVALPYYEGLRYPVLERTGTGPSTLDALLTPRP